MSRCDDFDHLNAIVNAPGVREHMRFEGDGAQDLSVLEGRALFLAAEYGFMVFEPRAQGVYMFHTAFLPGHRGRYARDVSRAAFEFMFLRTDALELHTYRPHENPSAKPPRSYGFRRWFSGPGEDFFRCHLFDWARNAPSLEQWGAWFHDRLEAAKAKQGAAVPTHAEDRANDRYAGLGLGMVKHGQPVKGVNAYNQWALTAGYHPVQIINSDPLVLDTGDAVVRVQNNRIDFLLCR